MTFQFAMVAHTAQGEKWTGLEKVRGAGEGSTGGEDVGERTCGVTSSPSDIKTTTTTVVPRGPGETRPGRDSHSGCSYRSQDRFPRAISAAR